MNRDLSEGDRLQLIDVRAAEEPVWDLSCDSATSPILTSEGDRALVVTQDFDRGADPGVLKFYPESNDFQLVEVENEAIPSTVLAEDGIAHLLFTEEDGFAYLSGPFAGPFELIAREPSAFLIDADGPTLVRVEATEGVQTLRAERDQVPFELTVPPGASAVALTPEGFVALRSTLSGFDLYWEEGERHIPNNPGTPIACPTFVYDYDPLDPCPPEAVPDVVREHVPLATGLAVDVNQEAWFVALFGTLSEQCLWVRQCFETLPCDCWPVVESSASNVELYMQAVRDDTRTIRISLDGMTDATPILASRAGEQGLVVVAAATESSQTTVWHMTLQP